MQEIWKKWEPHSDLKGIFYIKSVCDDPITLKNYLKIRM
jgi:hypothetical protein